MAREVIYWRGRGGVRVDVLQALSAKGYTVLSLRVRDEILGQVAKSPPICIIVDATAGDVEVSERIVELADASALTDVPIVFLAKHARERAEVLSRQFAVFIPMPVPVKRKVLIDYVEAFAANRSGVRISVRDAKGGVKGTTVLDPSRLTISYGGVMFASAENRASFNDKLLIPVSGHREALMELLENLADKDEWLAGHARRTAFVASAVANHLEMGETRDHDIRAAALLLNAGLEEGDYERAREDLFLKKDDSEKTVLAAIYERSAKVAREQLNNEKAAKIIDAIAAVVRGDSGGVSDELRMSAQCVLMIDLIDRACWSEGEWNPSGAYRSMRDLKNGSRFIDDEQLLESMARMLGEAVSTGGAVPSMIGAPIDPIQRRQREEALKAAVEHAERTYAKRRKSKVKLCDLKEGMELAAPAVSFDGQVLLPAGSVLDRDMIWRLWQLTIVRPIEGPLSILLPELKQYV